MKAVVLAAKDGARSEVRRMDEVRRMAEAIVDV